MPSPKPTPPSLLALGRQPLPAEIAISGGAYRLDKVFKHDFFAATARYAGPQGKVILKIGRTAPFFGLPLSPIGRILAAHESAALRDLADVDGVPRLLGRVGCCGLVHAYIEGRPLTRGDRVADDFFDHLRRALTSIHQRGMAYVDLEKCENVLVGDDGRPYLVDFQICWRVPRRWGGELWPLTWVRSRLQRADLYHLLKLQRRTRPDQLSEQQLRQSYSRPWYVRLHALVTRPVTLLRRRLLNRIDPRQKRGERGRVHE